MPSPFFVLSIIPEANAKVFPEPVAEPPITSFPATTKGIVFIWISLGSVNPADLTASKMP